MKKLRVALVDDEPLARERLARLLKELDCEILAELEDSPSLLEWLSGNPEVDALFLDIQMPGGTGLEAIVELKSPPPVVYVTAYSEHAVRAFETAAVDYILKPVFKDRLERTITRLRGLCAQGRENKEANPEPQVPFNQRFAVKAGVGHVFLTLSRVSHFEIEDQIVWAWSNGNRFRGPWASLSEVEAAFAPAGLLRIQRHLLLRPEAIIGIRPLIGGRAMIRIADNVELEVSRSMAPKVRELLGLG